MKKLIYTLIAFTVFHQFTFGQWVIQTSTTGVDLLDIEFINQNTGWACGDGGVILKTTNGGINWVQQVSGINNKILNGIHPVDLNTVYCVGWFQTILKTTNGGTNWQILRNGTVSIDASFFEVFFLNQNKGWLLRNSYVLRTSNGGNTFDSTQVLFSYLRDVYFKDSLNGVLCGDGALIMRTTDGGITWNQVTIPQYNFGQPDFFKESFIGNTGWVVGRFSDASTLGMLVWKTTNFGTTWDTVGRVLSNNPFNYETYCVYFSSINTGWCGGTFGQIFKTTNGGFNWIQQQVPSVNFRRSMWFFNDSVGWAAGGAGQIVHTTSGGQYLGLEPVNGIIPSSFTLRQNYPNPFNPATVIEFELPEADYYTLEIYDMLGRRIEVLMSEYKKAGIYRLSYSAEGISSGVYLYKLQSQKFSDTKKFILIK